MSEKEKAVEQKEKATAEPTAGEGVRSLQTWQRLAAARKALSADQGAREQLANDPAAYFRQFGVEGVAPGATAAMTDLERQLGVAPAGAPEMQLQSEARRGCAALVVVWAGAAAVNGAVAANVVGNANAAVNVNAAANANYAANANWTSNWNWAAGVSGL